VLLALTDHLRCTAGHAETWLVARADAVRDGWMVAGVLGCPVCREERVVSGGVVAWTVGATATSSPRAATAPDEAAVVRLAAQLALAESGAPHLLCGDFGALAPALALALGGIAVAPLVLLDPPDDSAAGLATIIRGAPRVPFAGGSVRAIALDALHAAPERIGFAVRALVNGGRLVAAADVPVPTGVRELARDATQWVGERIAEPVPITLGRARR